MAMSTVVGRTRWKVFALVFVVGLAGVGLMFTGLSRGALAASFSVSGMSYKASGDKLVSEGVVQYGSVDHGSSGAHPVLVNGFRKARIDNFCQSFVVPALPVVGDVTVKIAAPGQAGMSAENMVLGVEQVSGDMTLSNVEIGRDAGTFDKGPGGAQGPSGAFGIQADGAQIDRLRQVAWSTTASTLKLNQVRIAASAGHDECF
ncbi:cholesterol esterase [Saccharopolyspora erythraea]|nr:cholesterol esterase [Saccharopolyspora erythraea]